MEESKPSSVDDGHLSQPAGGWSPHRFGDCSRLSASASHLRAADSEIAAGRIALFTSSARGTRNWSLLLSRASRVPIWTVDAYDTRLPGFHRAPLLCAARTFLWPIELASDHPSPTSLRC